MSGVELFSFRFTVDFEVSLYQLVAVPLLCRVTGSPSNNAPVVNLEE